MQEEKSGNKPGNRRRIISFDFDQTLFDHESWSIPESAGEALRRLRENGNILVLATGRDMDNYYSSPFLKDLDLDARIDQNGTKVIADGKLIYDHRMDKKLLRRMLDYALESGCGLGFTIGDKDFYVNSDVIRRADLKRWGECSRNFHDPAELPDMEVRTVAFYGSGEEAEALQKQFPEVNVRIFAGFTGADIMEKECSKAEGLKLLCNYYGTSIGDSFAFGDSMNDYEILHAAGTGIAMGNACAALKQEADYVTTDIRQDGIKNACLHFKLI